MTTQTLISAVPLSKLLSIRLPKPDRKAIFIFSLCSVLFLSVLYIFQINEMMRKGYLIQNYQKQLETLVKDNKNLEINLAGISYLENIQKKTEELNFEKVQKIKYIQILDNSLAKK